MKDRIKQVRKEKGLTQTKFGEKIGVTGSTITGYEKGTRNPSDAIIKSICREFSVNEKWLRNGYGPMFQETDASIIDQLCSERGATDLERQLLTAYFKIDESIRGPFLAEILRHLRDQSSDNVGEALPDWYVPDPNGTAKAIVEEELYRQTVQGDVLSPYVGGSGKMA